MCCTLKKTATTVTTCLALLSTLRGPRAAVWCHEHTYSVQHSFSFFCVHWQNFTLLFFRNLRGIFNLTGQSEETVRKCGERRGMTWKTFLVGIKQATLWWHALQPFGYQGAAQYFYIRFSLLLFCKGKILNAGVFFLSCRIWILSPLQICTVYWQFLILFMPQMVFKKNIHLSFPFFSCVWPVFKNKHW